VELAFVADVDLAISDRQQGPLNAAGINAIRAFPGRGIRVWGARSISPQAEWKFIHARRLLSMIEDSVERSMQWVVFRRNDADLRRTLTHSLNVFLEAIWRQGGLQGKVPAEGFYVKCDEKNNPQAAIDTGQLVCQVGVAIAAPLEFLVFEITRSVAGAQVVEA
jgi:phage tail sheath protein FI